MDEVAAHVTLTWHKEPETERLGEWEPQPSELMNTEDAFQFKNYSK